ncbi:hypothetical protein POL68_24190 [Stigmatella sp. ncwal1]|uniref:Transposase n=1 Tax=Stigmatella ashevillensis TaxID=2995309 RepID=A0ABT5DD59_9BACT|nr:hypothetical protein [Stigmatella ashevillena]MDC0711592.1 hypothetical protein [Stigmatella ashevillena]
MRHGKTRGATRARTRSPRCDAWYPAEMLAERLSKTHAAEEIRRAIVEEVLPWVLGTWDPVLDVYRARRRSPFGA